MRLSSSGTSPRRRCGSAAASPRPQPAMRGSWSPSSRSGHVCSSRRGTSRWRWAPASLVRRSRRGVPDVIKPAQQTPLSMLALIEILTEAGLPAGGRQPASRRKRSGAVMEPLIPLRSGHASWSFTGSTTHRQESSWSSAPTRCCAHQWSWAAMPPSSSSRTRTLMRPSTGAMAAKMRNMGEACTAANRIYVHESVIDEFGRKLAEQMGALSVGNGTGRGHRRLGPLMEQAAQDKVARARAGCRRAGRHGAHRRVRAGMARATSSPRPSSPACPRTRGWLSEEIFGPVAPLTPFDYGGGGDRSGERHRVRSRRLCLHQ